MSSAYNPFGLIPYYSQSGIIRPAPLAAIASAYGTDIFQNAPVLVGGSLANSGNMVAVAAGEDNLWSGVFSGVEYNDLTGARRYLNRWIAGTVLPTNADLRAYYTADSPELIYAIQANATLTRAAIGNQYDFTAIAGSSVTGLASFGLDVASAAGAADAGQMRVVGLNPGPDNEWGDAFPVVLVMNSAHPWYGRGTAVIA